MILRHLGKPESLIQHVPDRPGHDRRYAIDSGKIRRELGWRPQADFTTAFQKTIDWYVANQEWMKNIREKSVPFAINPSGYFDGLSALGYGRGGAAESLGSADRAASASSKHSGSAHPNGFIF